MNIGVTCGVTVTMIDAVVAHWVASVGVNVYVAVAVLLTVDGDQVPVMPLLDNGGNTGAVDPVHIV